MQAAGLLGPCMPDWWVESVEQLKEAVRKQSLKCSGENHPANGLRSNRFSSQTVSLSEKCRAHIQYLHRENRGIKQGIEIKQIKQRENRNRQRGGVVK